MSASHVRRLLIFLAPGLFFGWIIWMKLHWPEPYHEANEEDGLIQYLQVVFYVLSGIVFLIAARRLRAAPRYVRWLALFAGFAMLFIAGEETQWGENLFRFQVPQYFATHNAEGELNIHNLPAIDERLGLFWTVLGFAGGLGWLVTQALGKGTSLRKWFVPPWYLSSYFLPLVLFRLLWEIKFNAAFLGGLFAGWHRFVDAHLFWWDQEPPELVFAAACFVLAVRMLLLARQAPPR